MKAFREIRGIQEAQSPEEKIIKKQDAIKRILNAYRIGKLEKSDANERLRRRGHNGIQESTEKELCPRTLAVHKPGETMPGVYHSFAYTGKIPNTGPKVCHLCGQREDDVQKNVVKEEVPEATSKKKSLKTFRGVRTETGERPNPIDTDPVLTLNKQVKSMNRMGL